MDQSENILFMLSGTKKLQGELLFLEETPFFKSILTKKNNKRQSFLIFIFEMAVLLDPLFNIFILSKGRNFFNVCYFCYIFLQQIELDYSLPRYYLNGLIYTTFTMTSTSSFRHAIATP